MVDVGFYGTVRINFGNTYHTGIFIRCLYVIMMTFYEMNSLVTYVHLLILVSLSFEK